MDGESWLESGVIKETVCFGCANLLYYPYCLAFPNGIPAEMRIGGNEHKEPFPGDNGIMYEAMQLENVVS